MSEVCDVIFDFRFGLLYPTRLLSFDGLLDPFVAHSCLVLVLRDTMDLVALMERWALWLLGENNVVVVTY